MSTEETVGLVGLLGFLGAVSISVLKWEQTVYRLVPFVYATIIAMIWSWSLQKPWAEFLATLAVTNFMAGGLLLVAWLQLRQK